MTRFIPILSTLCLLGPTLFGQNQTTVYQDATGQVLTTLYRTTRSSIGAYNRLTLLGSPFLTFPVWQAGKIQVDRNGQELACDLAYNMVTSEVLCRFPGDSAMRLVVPELFTIKGTAYVRLLSKVSGLSYHLYFTTVHEGQTKLLTSTTKRQEIRTFEDNGYNSYGKDSDIKGTYKTLTDYYIRKGDATPEYITLTKNSLLTVLYEQSDKLAARLPGKKLTADDVANVLTYYDGLMAADRVNKLPLAVNPVFVQTLHDRIAYPAYAQNQGVYGRVYAGFEIDEQGRIRNITLLSPDNGGFGFEMVVRNALEKLPALSPALRGKYALPVAFIYANSEEKTGDHSPVNRLADDRLEGRTLLEEFIVKAIVTKPVLTSREVWGYYK